MPTPPLLRHLCIPTLPLLGHLCMPTLLRSYRGQGTLKIIFYHAQLHSQWQYETVFDDCIVNVYVDKLPDHHIHKLQ